ncbi:J domain-containing protein [Psychrobacter sp.]|uniref:J domain-containing protein n=1 Tax=Psychrobacter sp. TaxID=56811 RepID=UPI0026006E61|nr:J domain-containing protein [Psychrobacter sp.]
MTQSCWEILGITPTSNESVIKKAYAIKLKDNKPDKNPVGFRSIREAYEQALQERFWYIDDANFNDDLKLVHDEIEGTKQLSSDLSQDIDNTHLTTDALSNYSLIDDTLDNEEDDGFVEAATEGFSLIIKGNSYYFKPTEQAQLNIAPLPLDAQQQLIDWHIEWQQCLEVADQADKLAQADNVPQADKSNQADPELQTPLNSDQQSSLKIDTRLTQCLTDQFEALKDYPLDVYDDYERALIVFFDDNTKAFPAAYNLAKSHFGWQQHIDNWQPCYPWHLLQQIDEGYNADSHFIDKHQFQNYMAKAYPLLYQHWDFSLPYSQAPSRWKFFCQLWFPIPAIELNQQINALQAQMLSTSTSTTINNPELNYPQLLILKQRLAPFGIIRWPDFLIIMLGVGAVIANLSLLFSYTSALYDYIGVVTIISLMYLYWQLQISYLANPEHNILSKPVRIGWGMLSLVLWLLFISPLHISTLPFNNYYAAHLAGLSTLLAFNSFMRPAHLKHIIWVATLCLLLFIVVLPIAANMSNQIGYLVVTKGSAPPLIWLGAMVPILLVTLGSYIYMLRPLVLIGKNFLSGFSLGSALLAFVILVTGSDILTSNYLLLTFMVSLFALVLIFMLMFISTKSFNEPDMF